MRPRAAGLRLDSCHRRLCKGQTRFAMRRPAIAIGLAALATALATGSCSDNTSGTCFDQQYDDGCRGRRETLCLSESACTWQPACVDVCTKLARVEDCETEPACRWADLNGRCLQASPVQCSELSAADCMASSSCTSEMRCFKELSCNRYRTEQGCKGGYHCEWSSHPRF
jgi:hypothetical protein